MSKDALNYARKKALCQEIGYFFGAYFEENGRPCIQHDGKTERYDSVDELLIAWHKIFTASPKLAGEWQEEIKFIENEIISSGLEDANDA